MEASFRNPIARRGTSVDIRVSGKNLIGEYDTPVPNALAAVYIRNQKGSSKWELITQSEVKHENGNPTFARKFAAEYKFELFQEIRIVIFDCHSEGAALTQQHLIGVVDTSLASIVSARGAALELELLNDSQKSTSCWVSVAAEEVLDAKKEVVLEISLRHLMTADEKTEQDEYLARLGEQLSIPSAAPAVQRRPMQAVGNLFRKEEKVPAIRPAHIENITHAEEQHREEVVRQIQQVHVAPPPFVPYLIISTCPEPAVREFRDMDNPNIPWEECYRSEDVMQYTDMDEGMSLNEIRVPQTTLNGGAEDELRYIKFSVMRASTSGGTIEVGHKTTTLRAMHDTVNPGQDATMHMNPSGQFTIKRYEIIELPSFLGTMKQSQLDMSLVVGIDFTQSNGPPQSMSSLHYQPQPGMEKNSNPYEAAIQSVANLLSAYSSDTRIAAYGFGAKIPPSWEVSHCFSLTGDPQMPLCDGVGALLDQYRNVLPRIQLWGPTMFSELLFNFKSIVSRRALAAKGTLAYTCALIVTDGVISDMDKTREQLMELSHYPCSIIIIGVGSENFTKMRTLDDSSEGSQPLKRGRDVAVRRFVQFVDYRSYAEGEQGQVDMSRLSEDVLGNIPDHVMQFIEYEKSAAARGK